MEKIVKSFIQHPLSTIDVMNICNNQANFFRISGLKNIIHIDELLIPFNACLLLYDRSDGQPGHWSVLLKHKNNVLEFFCSYGLKLDEALDFIDNKPYLSKLVIDSGYKLFHNDKDIQLYKDNINTCGRYCGMRLLLKNMNIKDFQNMFLKNKHYNSDFWVTILTLFCEN